MNRDTTRHVYDQWSDVYDSDGNPLLALEAPVLSEWLPKDLSGKRLIDLGCGTGRHLALYLERGADVVGLDLSEGMLAQARKRSEGNRVRLVTHDLEQPFPVENGTFDIAVSCLVIEHIGNPRQFFERAHATLKPGGLLIVTAMHPAMFLRSTQAGFRDPKTGEKIKPVSFPHSLADLVNATVDAGFVFKRLGEFVGTEDLARSLPRAEKYVGWPMLAVWAGAKK